MDAPFQNPFVTTLPMNLGSFEQGGQVAPSAHAVRHFRPFSADWNAVGMAESTPAMPQTERSRLTSRRYRAHSGRPAGSKARWSPGKERGVRSIGEEGLPGYGCSSEAVPETPESRGNDRFIPPRTVAHFVEARSTQLERADELPGVAAERGFRVGRASLCELS